MYWASISGIHCCKLAENINAFKVFTKVRLKFDVMVTGSVIPEWFSHQAVDSSIKVQLPHNVHNDSQWMGVALCCIFVNDDDSRDEDIECQARNSGNLVVMELFFTEEFFDVWIIVDLI